MIRRLAIALLVSFAFVPLALAAGPFADTPLDVLRAAAERGDAAAQFELADRLQFGHDVAEDRAGALTWYRRAAEQGHAKAQHALAMKYYYGRGVARDDAEAVKWWRRAAEQGNASSQYWLGSNYEYGMAGLPMDVAEAARWYRKAAEQGNPEAQSSLGQMYDEGKGVPQSTVEAVAWYRKAADQGESTAQHALGEMYAAGRGVPKDEKRAVELYAKGAEQGFNVSMSSLGDAYTEGRGTAKNPVCAYFWHALAASRDYGIAQQRRDALEKTLTPAELADGKRMVAATTVTDDGPVQRPFCPGELLSVSAKDTAIGDLMAAFRQVSGFPILGLEKETRPVTVEVHEVFWETALTETLKGLGYSWSREGDAIRVTPLARPAS